MADIKPEWVEAATLALVNARRVRHGLSPIDRMPWAHTSHMERANMSAALAAVVPLIQADALREAAEAFGENQMITDEAVEAALWAWITSAAVGVTRENVNPRVLDLNRHRARAALEAALPLIRADALAEADKLLLHALPAFDAVGSEQTAGYHDGLQRARRVLADVAKPEPEEADRG